MRGRRFLFGVVSMMMAICWGVPALAETAQDVANEVKTLKDKLQTIEKRLESAENVTTRIDKEEAALKEDKKTRAVAYYRDGFFIETPDKEFRLQIGGVLHFDCRQFQANRSASGFDIRRARYDMRGYQYRSSGIEQSFRIQLEMADTAYLRNCYWMFKAMPELTVQIGQFKIPAGGADFLTEEAQVNFIEYATETPVSPFFDRGINVISKFLDGRIQTCLAAFTGVGVDVDVNKGDQDNNKDYVVRLLLVPFKNSGSSYIKGMHLAGSYQDGIQSIKTVRGEANNRSENYESSWYRWSAASTSTNNVGVDLDERTRYGGELHWIVGPGTFSYEFNRVQWENLRVYRNAVPATASTLVRTFPDDYHSDVHQVWVSYFLTGEEKQFEDIFFAWRQPKPKKNFSLKEGTWGAWEVLARYAFHTTSTGLFGGTDAILDGSSQGHSVTGGLRWIWNPKARLMLDVNYLKSTEGPGITIEKAEKGSATNRSYREQETAALFRIVLTP